MMTICVTTSTDPRVRDGWVRFHGALPHTPGFTLNKEGVGGVLLWLGRVGWKRGRLVCLVWDSLRL